MGIALPQVVTQSKASGAQIVDGSLKFNGSDSVSLTRTVGSGNRTTWTWSAWVKTDPNQVNGSGGFAPMFFGGLYNTSGQQTHIAFGGSGGTSGQLLFTHYDSSYTTNLRSSSRYRDIGWYHIVVVFDSNNGTSGDRARVYVNGERVTTWASETYPSSGGTTWINDSSKFHGIGKDDKSATENCFDGAMSQVYFIDGQALGPESFGYTDGLTNTWRPKKYTGEFNFTVGTTNYTSISTLAALAGSTLNSSYNDVSKVFDGSGTGVRTVEETSNQGEKLSITFSPAITLSNQTVSIDTYSTYQGMFVTVGGADGSRVSGSDSNTTTLTTGSLSGSLSKITVDNGTDTSGRGASILRIRIGGSTLLNPVIGVNGFYLPMDGNSPIGEDKSGIVTINDGRTWSGTATISSGGAASNKELSKGFDGSVATAFEGDTSGATVTVPVSATISAGGVRVYAAVTGGNPLVVLLKNGDTTVETINGGINGGRWYASSSYAGAITSLVISRTGRAPEFNGIEIGGTVLIDNVAGNNWTPVNFGGSVALDNPQVSGARPILNTLPGGTTATPGVLGSRENKTFAVTVASVGGGNRYHFDGVDRPNPTLIRGATYTFDQSNNSNSTHPLRFATAADAAGSTQYTNGVITRGTPGSAGAYTKITVPHNAPDTLYYYCTNHSGMGSSTSQITDETKANPYAWKNVLALPLVGSKDDVSTQISPVILNDVTRIRFKTDWNWMYVSAIEINGTILTTGTLDNSGGVWSGGDNWKNGSVGSGQETYSQAARGDWFDVTLASTLNIDKLRIYVYLDASAGSTTNIFELELFYGGGLSYLKVLPSNSFAPNGNFNQRSWQDFGSVTFKSLLSTNAVASSAQSNFYGGSWYFDGSGDTLTIPDNTDFNFGGDDSTIEMWVYPTRISGTQENLMTRGTSGYSGFIMSVTNFLDTVNGSSWGVNITYDNPLVANKWQHIAVCRNGDTWTVYINGIANGSATASGSVQASAQTLTIGQRTGQTDFQGYMSDIHIYKGAAKYTSNFIVPATSPDILPDTPSGVSGGSKLAKVTEGAVSFDGSGDYLLSGASSDYNLGTGNFTIEGYIYPNSASGTQGIMGIGNAVSPACQIFYNVSNSQKVRFNVTDGTAIESTGTAPAKAWSHFAVVREGTGSNETKIYINGKLEAQGTISTNLTETTLQIGRPNTSSGTEYFNGFISNFRVIKGTALYTSNFTPPTRTLTNVTNTKLLCCQSNTLAGSAAVSPNLGGVNDGTVWSRFLSSPDDPDGSESYKLFDGNISNLYSPGANTITFDITSIGGIAVSTSLEVYFSSSVSARDYSVNGGSAVNSGTGTKWVDLGFTGTFNTLTGTNGGQIGAIRIDGSTILLDPVSPVGNVAATNFNPFNTDINTVRGQESGYATMNPIGKTKSEYFVQDGNLTCGNSSAPSGSSGSRGYVPSTISFRTGKWYAECVTIRASDGDVDFAIGIFSQGASGYYQNDGTTYNCRPDAKLSSPGNLAASYGVAWADGDCIGIKVDLDSATKTIQWLKNGIATGDPVTISTDHEFFFGYGSDGGGGGRTYTAKWNFGQKPFKFPPPAGFQPLNAANVRPETVITRPDHYVDVDTYTGTTPNPLERSNFSFAPDFLWFKSRAGNRDHVLFDTVRGRAQGLKSNGADAQAASGATQDLVSFDNNGFTVGEIFRWSSTNRDESLVVWAWKAGGNKNTFNVDDVGYASAAAAGLTGGSITPTGSSVGTRQGFSIVKYEANLTQGATIAHGLTQKPDFAIFKNLDSGLGTNEVDWGVYHSSIGATKRLELNQTVAAEAFPGPFNNTEPTSSLFTFGGGSQGHSYLTNGPSGDDFIGYIWHDVPGLQKFGSYEGNSVADGPFVELGFQPAIIWLKNADDGTNRHWCIVDGTRTSFNKSASAEVLFADDSQVESYANNNYGQFGSKPCVDILSNGFKVREGDTSGVYTQTNRANTIIYCAWAESPSVNLYGAQSNAR